MSKVKPDKLSALAKTLLVPLYFRAVESQRQHPLVADRLALELVEQIDYEFPRFAADDPMQATVMLRVREFDRLIQQFLNWQPQGTVINIGCGLDTRFQRLDNGGIRWFELDLAEVIALRRQFFQESERYRFISSSVLECDWMDTVLSSSEGPWFFIAEGVFYYFSEAQIRPVILGLNSHFPGALVSFDVISPLQVLWSRFQPALNPGSAPIEWGLVRGSDIEKWHPDIHLLRQIYYLDRPEARVGWLNQLALFPGIGKGFSIVQFRLGHHREG